MVTPNSVDSRHRQVRVGGIVLSVLIAGVTLGWGTSATAAGQPSPQPRPGHSASMSKPSTSIPSRGPQAPRPPANGGFDYQIGKPYAVPPGVAIVSRDRSAEIANGMYNICYVNGFQAQQEETNLWKRTHNNLLLKKGKKYVVDGGWNEILFDISTASKRESLAAIVGGWIDQCAGKGYQAIEIDNLDSWTRSRNLLTRQHTVAYAKLLADRAHRQGLAVAQKNSVEIAAIGKSQVGFDFAIAESCADYEITRGVPECQGYVDVYGTGVLVIEYDDVHFRQACARYGSTLSIVRRDRNVSAPGSSAYAFKMC